MPASHRSALIAALVRHGPTHRATLARALTVSRQTVTNLADQLLQEGILTILPKGTAWPHLHRSEGPLAQAAPATQELLGISTGAGVFVSIAVLDVEVAVAVTTLDGRLIASETGQIDLDAPARSRLDVLAELAERALAFHRPLACYLALPTQMDRSTGAVLSATASRRWVALNPMVYMAERLGTRVFVQNAARLQTYAETLYGAGREKANVCLVHASAGIAMGQVLDGRIAEGSHGGAGELGHIIVDWNGPRCDCGNRGCLMLYCSTGAIDKALAGDRRPSRARIDAVHEAAGAALGRGLVTVAHLIDPDVFVLAGPATHNDHYVAAAADVLNAHTLELVRRSLDIRRAQVADDPLVVAVAGAHDLAVNHPEAWTLPSAPVSGSRRAVRAVP